MKKRAIFGGSFNPIHWGHLVIAEIALDQFDLQQVIWVPTHHPPHKQGLADFSHRLTMVQQAVADQPAFTCSGIEAQRPGPSYAIDTLKDLQTQFPDSQWFWIMGSDAFTYLARWRGSQWLMAQCCWLVAPRPEEIWGKQSKNELPPIEPACWHYIAIPPLGISSSLIRGRCSQGQSIRYLVPDAVDRYITDHQLYQN